MTLGVVATGCADPTGDYEDFLGLVTDRANALPPASDQCLGTATSEVVDLTGTFAAYCRVYIASSSQALVLRADMVQAGSSLSVTLSPLKIKPTTANDTVGDPPVTSTSELVSGEFAFDVGTVRVSGSANPLSGSDIQVDGASFKGLVISA
ncbi:MAG: hypothetical protein EOO75_05640, partial [Myxococcales bacterium]